MTQSVRTWIAFGFLGLGFLYIAALALTALAVPLLLAFAGAVSAGLVH